MNLLAKVKSDSSERLVTIVQFLGADYGANFRAVCVDLKTKKISGVEVKNLELLSNEEELSFYEQKEKEAQAYYEQRAQVKVMQADANDAKQFPGGISGNRSNESTGSSSAGTDASVEGRDRGAGELGTEANPVGGSIQSPESQAPGAINFPRT